ncbi:MAG: trans-sulfuration enzyme family protein, partial [Candidatus Dormibacteraceae bacterium]
GAVGPLCWPQPPGPPAPMRPGSRAVHAGREIGAHEPLGPAIFQTSVYVYDDLDDYDTVAGGERPGHVYARNSNENVAMLETAIADLEGAPAAVATGSGMAALLVAILALSPRPAPLVAPLDLYGGTSALLRRDLEPLGYGVRVADFGDLPALERLLDGAGLVLCETITNPLSRVADLAAVCRLAGRAAVPVLVDNTFATPILSRPLELGAAAVVHSATKYIGGHSDLVAGVVAGGTEAMSAARGRAGRLGTTLGPFEAWLALRGLRTLALRMARVSESSLELASRLEGAPGVAAVHHPLLAGNPDREIAARLLPRGAGGMFAFQLGGGREAAERLQSRLRMVRFAASLGGVETTVSYPEITSHRSLSPEQRSALGVTGGTVRVSTGIEDPADIVEDFLGALEAGA